MKFSRQNQRAILLIDEANKKIRTADHLIYITYPLVKENRLFIKIFELLHDSICDAVQALLQLERMHERLVLSENFYANFSKIRQPSYYQNYNLSEDEIKIMDEIFKTMESHKNAPLEFVRKDSFVIFNDGIRTNTLNIQKLKDYTIKIRKIIGKIEVKVKFS